MARAEAQRLSRVWEQKVARLKVDRAGRIGEHEAAGARTCRRMARIHQLQLTGAGLQQAKRGQARSTG